MVFHAFRFVLMTNLNETQEPCYKVLSDVFCRQEWPFLCAGTGERQTTNPHGLQKPKPRMEYSLYIVSLGFCFHTLFVIFNWNILLNITFLTLLNNFTVLQINWNILTYCYTVCWFVGIWPRSMSLQPCQRHSWCSGGDYLWWGWRQGARLPWKSCHSSAFGTYNLTKSLWRRQ